jgi:nucleotide-binding universal stress UspA family protein
MGYEARMAAVHERVRKALDEFAARCAAAGVAHAERNLVGAPHSLIEAQAQFCDVVLLARDSQFRFTTRDHEHGETLRAVLKNSTRPIVVVPETSFPDGPIAIAYDGSLQAARALAAFQATGLGESGKVRIISVAEREDDAARQAETAQQYLSYHKVDAVPFVVKSSADPAGVILDRIQQLGTGLLVMGACGQRVLREFFLGSATCTMLAKCPVPVFVFH